MAAQAAGLDLFAIDAAHLYARQGDPYRGPDGADWSDNAFRFAALSRVAVLLAQGLVPGYRPDVVHAHDWQAGLVPAYLHYAGAIDPPTVMTIHNLAFQGQFPAGLLAASRLSSGCVHRSGRRILRRHRIPEGWTAIRRPDHHGIAHLRRGDPSTGRRRGSRRSAPSPRRRAVGHPQRRRYACMGPARTTRISLRRSMSIGLPNAPRTRRRCRLASASGAIRRSCCSA